MKTQNSILNSQINNANIKTDYEKGQALIMVILIGLITLIAVVSVTTLVISELKKNTSTIYNVSQYQIAFGALENAFMQLLRNPGYTGETMMLNSVTCIVTVTGDATTKSVESRCTNGAYVKKIGATVVFANGLMTVSSITELP